MSQPQGKKKGFVAPFHAPSLSQEIKQKGSDSGPAKDAAVSSEISPSTKEKSKKKKRPAAPREAGDISSVPSNHLRSDDAGNPDIPAVGVTAPHKPFDHLTPGNTASDPADTAPAAAKKAKLSKKPKKTRSPPVSDGGEGDVDGDRVLPSAVPELTAKDHPPPAAGTAGNAGSASDGDEACAPAAEPALPVGSALTTSAPADLTPPDAPVTSLSSPPAVFKRPNPGPGPLTSDPETGPPPVKRRLYTGKPRDKRGSSSAGSRHRRPKSANVAPRDQKARILALQARRTCGTWVQCCQADCGKWRYLADVQDPSQVPQVWHCTMNDDARYSWCSSPQEHIPNSSFPHLVAVKYTVGSLVWARLAGFPWWPAVVDDDPDTEDFFWLDGLSETPTHYHVTFLDAASQPVTRAWVSPANVKKFEPGDHASTRGKTRCRGVEYRSRLEAAVGQAREALSCSLQERRRRFTFVARYRGPWPLYSDSDAETARLSDGRRAVRKKRRDRRRARPTGSKSQVSRGLSPARPGRRERSPSSGSGSGSFGDSIRDDETVNSLMDVVDDIVLQLTQSQSQSQSQSQGRRSHGGAGDVSPMFSDAFSDVDVPPTLAAAGTGPKINKKSTEKGDKAGPSVDKAGDESSVSKAADKPKVKKAAASEANKPKKVKMPALGGHQTAKPAETPRKKVKKAPPVDVDDFKENVPPGSKPTKEPVAADKTTASATGKTPKKKAKKALTEEGGAEASKANVTPKKIGKKTPAGSELVTPKQPAKPRKQKTPTAEGKTERAKPAFSVKKTKKTPALSAGSGVEGQEAAPEEQDPTPSADPKPTDKPEIPKQTSPVESVAQSLEPSPPPQTTKSSSAPTRSASAPEHDSAPTDSLAAPDTPSPRYYTELQSELTASTAAGVEQTASLAPESELTATSAAGVERTASPGPAAESQELFEPVGAAATDEGEDSDPFEADD